jgi:biotin carboxyl carrier protein
VKYVVRVEGRPIPVEVIEKGGALVVRAGGREEEAEFRRIRGDGSRTLRLGRGTRCVVVGACDGEATVTLGTRVLRVAVEDEREAAAHAVRGPAAAGPRVLRSAMPGIVRQVLVAPGDRVAAKAPLLVLEAMKMQNEIRADLAGRVEAVHVAPGTTVARGAPLLTLSPEIKMGSDPAVISGG